MVIANAAVLTPEQTEVLLKAAEEIVKVRQQYQGALWWETINARQRSLDLQRWANFNAEDRAAWMQSFVIDSQARSQMGLGKYTEALPLYREALAIREKVLGPEHPHTAASLNNLAVLHHAQGQDTQAHPLLQRVLVIYEKLFGAEHPATATSLNNLAELYEAQGQYAEALPLLQRALVIREKVLGPEHPATATSLNNLAELYKAQGQYAEALPLLQRALVIREKILGPEHPDTAASLSNLAGLYVDQGQYAQALPLHQRALVIREKVLGPEHPDTATSLSNLALTMFYSRPDEESASLLLRASQSTWQYLTRTFPTLSPEAQKLFFAKSKLRVANQVFWSFFAAMPGVDRGFGLEETLLSKHLLGEAARQEGSAMRQLLADAVPAWRTLWQERDGLRRQYAMLAIASSSDSILQQNPRRSPNAPDPEAIGQLAKRLEELETQLRTENPAYARQAQLDTISVTQVATSLQTQQALLEYVQFRPYDHKTKKLTTNQHYGVYIVRGDQSPIVAVDLGEAAPIDAAIQQFHAGMREIIDPVKNGMTPSSAQFRKSEAALAQWSSKLRTWIWRPLEPHLRGVTRVYVAPEGQLSLLPFEVLADKTKAGTWQYLVEEQELVYVNTGRDLARLALTAKTPDTASTKTAILIGNPAFNASPQQVARAVATMPMSAPTIVAQGNSRRAAPTLGAIAGNGGSRLQVPRNWEPVPALGALLNHAQHQLTRANWSVITVQQEQAVEEAVLRVQAPQILQVATHGYLLDHVGRETNSWDNPLLRSMLLFSGVNRAENGHSVFYRMGKDLLSPAEAEQRGLTPEQLQAGRLDVGDGVLTAYEVTGMNLQGTELVNLTACETGLGQITPDGVAGLRQAFFLAGARSLTTSLWEVPAEETTTQIEAFYTRWLGTKTSAKTKTTQTKKANQPAITRYQAFRQTQLAALASARKDWNGAGHPFFWAGTIYLGDPGDLPVLDDSR
ncbi:MAG: tetratricopeptide repeat protein [Nitrospira sp.]|nr:tetratricopeptide repeat protein [Nitrospira sp.]